jgi:glycosyltransferase involved in cell wall biosynthesis
MAPSVLICIVHYQTADLLGPAVASLRREYPSIPLLVVDNGSSDGSENFVRELGKQDDAVSVRMLERNMHHGPAMDLVLTEAQAELVFFLDSDTVTVKGGFLEPMAELAIGPSVLAVGQVVTVDARGFAARTGIPVPASAHMMVNRAVYLDLPPFVHHGLPVLGTCREANARGIRVESFPVEDYVDHLGRGTARRFWYGLGLRSRLAYLMHRLGF